MFRLQDNVPEVYVNQSRDFQVLCRLYDCWHGASKFNIDCIENILDPMMCPDTYLELLATRVGFFPRIHIDSNVLRYIISSFSNIIKNKGTKKSILEAIYCILKAENNPESTKPVLIYFDTINHNINIYTGNFLYNKLALNELLSYVLPFGYTYELNRYTNISDVDTSFVSSDVVKTLAPKYEENSLIVGSNSIISDRNLLGTYNTTVVVGSRNISNSSADVQLSTPQNVTIENTTLSWDAVENATSYDVLSDGTSIGEVKNEQ